MSAPDRDEDETTVDEPEAGEAEDEPGRDLLAEACERAGLGEEALEALTQWLAHELESERFARLEQAGHAQEERIPLAKVFVDLEVAHVPVAEGDEHRTWTYGFIEHLCHSREQRSSRRPATSAGRFEVAEGAIEERVESYLLMGGPGQGKSTLGQLLCQLHRARLLAPRSARIDNEAHRRAVEAFAGQAAQKALGRPAEPRFPIRVPLAEAAAWLARDTGGGGGEELPALLRFLAARAAMSGPAISASDVDRVLRVQEWLIVLDGLDEVPDSSDRDRLLGTMRDVLQRYGGAQRGLLVATTRPQGYGREFEELARDITTCNLVPLSKQRAMAYADRLVEARFLPERRAPVRSRLEQATEGESTKRLMRTPLQVTIMATLVDRIGRAPSERWTLFKEYYRVVYERETERDIPAAQLLRDYRAYVDRIHAQVGLLLQAEAERSGGADAAMSPERFKQVVAAVLAEDEIDGARRESVAERLSESLSGKLGAAVQQRLVLLVELRPDKLGFEVRSIQEFMAAWALSQKGEETVEARIRRVAKAASFRNVVLFLASKAFTELSELREALTDRICPGLNDDPEDGLARATLAGSVLALEILEEGSALKQTKYVRKLVELSAKLMTLPPSPLHGRLARACVTEAEVARVAMPVVQKAIAERLEVATPEHRLGAWVVLVALANEEEAWARELAEARWGDDAAVRRNSVFTLERGNVVGLPWLYELWLQTPNDVPPRACHGALWDNLIANHANSFSGPWLILSHLLLAFDRIRANVDNRGKSTPLSLKLIPMRQDGAFDWAALANVPAASPAWAPFVEAAKLVLKPDARTLADGLERLANTFDAQAFRWAAQRVPWPLGACLDAVDSADQLLALARKAANGALGDGDAWLQAEDRWGKNTTIEFDESLYFDGSALPYSGDIITRGFTPFGASSWWRNDEVDQEFLSVLRRAFDEAKEQPYRTILADWITTMLHAMARAEVEPQVTFSVEEADAIWRNSSPRGPFPIQCLVPLRPWDRAERGWAELLDRIGRSMDIGVGDAPLRELPEYVAGLFRKEPTRTGLLGILHLAATQGVKTWIDPALLRPERFDDKKEQHFALMLQLAQGELSPEEAVAAAAQLSRESGGEWWPLAEALRVLEHLPKDLPFVEPALLSLFEHAPAEGWPSAGIAVRQMRSIVTARPTGLDDPSVWNDLRLPLPYPERRRSSTKLPPALERRPVRIETISLHNIRLFDDLSLEPAPPDNGSGQWLVLLGENGVGKSTLLRSFVFALGPVERPGYLPPAAFAAPWRSHGLDIDAPCYIQVRADGHLYRTRIERKNEDDIPIPQDPPSRPLVFAYGARRGSALGGANRDVRFEPGSEIATLFDEGASLIHAETWLLVRKYDAVDNSSGTPVQLWQTIERVLLDMLPGVQRIFIRERRLWFEGEAIGETLITGLSDGYLTTLGWVVDLIARWIELVERRKEPIPERFNEHMTGLVLIDDIDMQLHPDWQRRVIADVRKAFPRMSFVVTTHNPLTLLGARAEEIWQFERNDDGHVTAQRGEQLPALMTAAQILRSYFGINRTFPAPLGEKLQRLAFLVGNRRRTEEEDAEMDRITAELHEAGADPGWVPVPRDPESVRR